jgi:hypothetical protein
MPVFRQQMTNYVDIAREQTVRFARVFLGYQQNYYEEG